MRLVAHIGIDIEPAKTAESLSERHVLTALAPVLDGTIYRALIDRELHGRAGTTRISGVTVSVRIEDA